jgi:hypothetical protein
VKRTPVPQDHVLAALQVAIDEARIADPVRGPRPHARRKIRRILRDHPEQARSFKVLYNLGRERREWLITLMEHDSGKPRDVLLGHDSPWLDDTRANGPLEGGHADDIT